MENETNSPAPVKARSNQLIWLIVIVVVVGLALVCCLLVIAGILLFRTDGIRRMIIPPQPTIQTVPNIPDIPPFLPPEFPATEIPSAPPAELPSAEISDILIVDGEPNWGSVDLQRGSSPDPYSMGVGSFGKVDTSQTELACGFTTDVPTYTFSLTGGASESPLRIAFVPDEKVPTTLIVYTPDHQWLCGATEANVGGSNPFLDFDFGPSGKYVIWIGVQHTGDSLHGELFIGSPYSFTP